jgi:hypothetical protein
MRKQSNTKSAKYKNQERITRRLFYITSILIIITDTLLIILTGYYETFQKLIEVSLTVCKN